MKSKIIIGRILTSLLFILLVSNYTTVIFSGYENRSASISSNDDDKASFYWNDEGANSIDVNFSLQKEGVEEELEPLTGWLIYPSYFKFDLIVQLLENVVVHYYEHPVLHQAVPIWIFTRKIII